MIDVDKLYEEWLAAKVENVKPLSYDKYESTGRLYVLPFLKRQPIESLNISIITDFFNRMANDGLSNNTIQTIKMTLKSLYLFAEKLYSIDHIDFSLIKISLNKKKDIIR